jgi:FlaA1/EpsC-like NDP-sugar epimerase
MLGPFDYFVWVASFVLEVYVVVCSFCRKDFQRYASLNIYMSAAAFVTAGEFWKLYKYGFASLEYRFFYYYTDCLLTVLLYFAVTGLYNHVFREMGVGRYIRLAAALLLIATAGFSYLVVAHHRQNLGGRFVVEVAQNLYFVGVMLTYLLWVAVLKMHETRVRLIQLILALGIYFSAFAAVYAMRNLFPGLSLLRFVPPLIGTWLPLAWAYTFTRVPEEARLATARLAARPSR